MTRLKNFMSSTEYFKSKPMDEKTVNAIVMSTTFHYSPRGSWVFRAGEPGDSIYILIHGHCKTIEQNRSFLSERRNLREQILKMYQMLEDMYGLGSKLMSMDESDP